MLVHIDFGFVLGHAPGGRFSLERAPFKLTAEMGDILGGPTSSLWVRRPLPTRTLMDGWAKVDVVITLYSLHVHFLFHGFLTDSCFCVVQL